MGETAANPAGFTAPPITAAIVGGIGHLTLALIAFHVLDHTAQRSSTVAFMHLTDPVFVWVLAGMAALGAVPAALYAKYGVVLPGGIVCGLFAVTFYATWSAYREAVATGAAIAPSLRPFDVYTVGWILPLALVLGVSVFEYNIRE